MKIGSTMRLGMGLAFLLLSGCSTASPEPGTTGGASGGASGSGTGGSSGGASGTASGTSGGAAAGASGNASDSSGTQGGSSGTSSGTGQTDAGGVTTAPPTPTTDAGIGASTDTHWSDGLRMGPNGPIPVIVVDQFGYRPGDKKVAVIRNPQTGYDSPGTFSPGSSYSVVDVSSGKTVKTGAPVVWNTGKVDPASGDVAWWFDFSDVTTPGTYYVFDSQKNQRSPEFAIASTVFRGVLKQAMRMFFYQRAGQAKTAATAGASWADGASHLGAGQDLAANAWTDQKNNATARDVHGGWFDAGDFNKYTNWAARYVITLLATYHQYPTAFTDDFGIPESGNGIPDVLDEVKWELDWIVRMQNADGSVSSVEGLSGASPPSAATGPSYYGPASTSATLSAAAAFSYAAHIFGARTEPTLTAYAADLKTRAMSAWTYANANPNVLYYNNDNSKQPNSAGLASGQQEVDDAGRLALKVEAAAYLFEQTGDTSYRTFFDQNYASTLSGLSVWQVDLQEVLLRYAAMPNATPSVVTAIQTKYIQDVTTGGDFLVAAHNQSDPYSAPLSQYTWGSSQVKASAGRALMLASDFGLDASTAALGQAAAEDYVHYFHGVNPLGLVYLTNMTQAGAENSADTLFHTWFCHGSPKWEIVSSSMAGPAPGYLVGGPNPSYALDGCCTDGTQCSGAANYAFCSINLTPPLGQPPAKSYRQFDYSWPVDSWAVTEPSDGYQAQYVRLLAAFAQ